MEILPISTNTVAKSSKRPILLLLCEYQVLRLEQSRDESQDTTGCTRHLFGEYVFIGKCSHLICAIPSTTL